MNAQEARAISLSAKKSEVEKYIEYLLSEIYKSAHNGHAKLVISPLAFSELELNDISLRFTNLGYDVLISSNSNKILIGWV
jgi:hypothetical protein